MTLVTAPQRGSVTVIKNCVYLRNNTKSFETELKNRKRNKIKSRKQGSEILWLHLVR